MTLSAKSNEQVYYSIEITDQFAKENKFNCIGCNAELVYHRNISGEHTQHWAHKTPCIFETEPESEEHIKLKQWCYENFEAPTKHKPDSFYTGNQKPDLLLEYPTVYGTTKVAIECQCSKISLEKLMERTFDYTQKGIHVLWILGSAYTSGNTPFTLIGKELQTTTKSFSIIEKWLQSIYFGRVYYFTNNCIQPAKLLWVGYKKRRFVSLSPTTFRNNIQINYTNSTDQQGNKILIARLWDKMWWSG